MLENDNPIVTQNGTREPLLGLVNASKALFFLALTIFVGISVYLVWTNPSINSPLNKKNVQQNTIQAEIKNAKARKWTYDVFSDIDIKKKKYPIVVLRTGFKVIRIGPERSLVGWKYEIINTSPKNRYLPTVSFTLQDVDGFDIATGKGDTIVQPESYGVITGTITVDNFDIERLSQSTWSIKLLPDWATKEQQTSGDRYSRLTKLTSVLPLWVPKSTTIEILVGIEKWKAIKTGLDSKLSKEKSLNQ